MTARFVREAVIAYRRRQDGPAVPATQVTDSRLAAEVLRTAIPDGPQERFVVLALDARNVPIGWHLVAVGGLNAASISPSDVFRYAVMVGANAVIVGHNHPSGSTEPSDADIAITKKLRSAGELLGVKVLDHLILGDGDHYSLMDHGRLS